MCDVWWQLEVIHKIASVRSDNFFFAGKKFGNGDPVGYYYGTILYGSREDCLPGRLYGEGSFAGSP